MGHAAFGLHLDPSSADRKNDDGILELLQVDLFEISIVPAPANNDTRVLG